jgi:phage tail sheath gpL-like
MTLPNLLSLNFLVPFVAHKLDFSRAIRGLRGMPRRLLLIGHGVVDGLHGDVQNTIVTVSSETQAVELFGEGSQLLAMWRAASANAGMGLPIDCLACPYPQLAGDHPLAAEATVGLLVAFNYGTHTNGPGFFSLYIGGVQVPVPVAVNHGPAEIAASIVAAVNAMPSLPMRATIGSAIGAVTLTCKWPGVSGNDIDVRYIHTNGDEPKGMVLTVTPVNDGADAASALSVPSPSTQLTAMDALAGYRATEIVSAFTDNANINLLVSVLEDRWGANNMQDGQLCVAVRDLIGWPGLINSPMVHCIATRNDMTNPWETAAMAGAAIETQAGIDPAVPATGIPLVGYVGPLPHERMTVAEANDLLLAGSSPLQIAQDGSATLSRMVTTYTHTPIGTPDASMRELCWIKTMSYYRWFHVTEFQLKYTGFKLAEYLTDPIPGQKIMTKELGEEIMLGLYKTLQGAGLVQNYNYYRDTLLVEVDGPNGKLKIQDEPVLVTQHYQTELTSYVVAGHV